MIHIAICYNIPSMIADIHITEKSFGDKTLMRDVKFSVDDGEKVGVVGRNGVGKSTLFGILAGTDTDYTGEVIFRRGITVASTAQEHHGLGDQTVLSYILAGLPEYASLKKIIDEYPETKLYSSVSFIIFIGINSEKPDLFLTTKS